MRLDLNTVQRPTLELVMMDEEQTVLRVMMPNKAMFKELTESDSVASGAEGGDGESSDALYDLVARLLSCNRDRIKVTAEELEHKYNLDLESVILVYKAYIDFVFSIIKEKN